jgi:multiple sugar transport system substrate-binding protein
MKKMVLGLLVMAVAVSPAFAGGRQQSGGNTAGSKEMTLVISGTPQPHEKEYYIDVFVKKFETQNSVKVNVEFVSQADTITKIRSEQSTGKIISDVVFADTANMAPYISGGWMQDISRMIHAGTTYTTMFDSTTNSGGSRFFVPQDFDVYVLAAHVDALKYLPTGLTRQDVVNGITWEQYAEWAINIARGEGVGKTMFPASATGSQLLYPMAGMSLAYGGGFPDFTSSGFKNAMQIIADMAQGNAFYPEQAQYSAPTDPMNAGDVWLTFAHMNPVGFAYNAAPNGWVIGAAPKGSKGIGSTSGAWCWGVSKGAPHADLAAKWIDYVTTPQVNYDFCVNLGGVLSPVNEVAPLLGNEDVIMTAGSKILKTAIVSGVPSTEYKDWNAVKLLYIDAFNQILNTKAVPSDEFLKNLETKCVALKN